MNIFEQTICDWTAKVLNNIDDSRTWDTSSFNELVEKPPNPDMGDYALPCFSFANSLRRPPFQIAVELAE